MFLHTVTMSQIDDDHLIEESKKVVSALGKMFAPFCEVVLHDLRDPGHAIVAIENNLSGRQIGDATTNMGLARVKSIDFPDVVQNYPNTLADGRQVKSTSIGIRSQDGTCIGSICLNFDTTHFAGLSSQLAELTATTVVQMPLPELLKAAGAQEIHNMITNYALRKGRTPGQLSTGDKRELIQILNEQGFLRLRNAIATTASALHVTRPTIYKYLKTEA